MIVFPGWAGWQATRVCSAPPAPAYDWHSQGTAHNHTQPSWAPAAGRAEIRKTAGSFGVLGFVETLQMLEGEARGRERLVGG